MTVPKYTSKLQGSKVVVIGGSAGIGYAAAEASLESGAHVYLASSSSTRIEAAVSRLTTATHQSPTATGGSVQGRAIDLGSDDSVRQFIDWVSADTTVGKARGIDHVVFTAGDALRLGDLMDTDLEDAKGALEVRFWGALRVIKFTHSQMKDRGRSGSITLTSGTVAYKPAKGWAVASGMGGAIESITRGLAVDLAPTRVNCILPGAVDTPLWDPLPAQVKAGMMRQFEDKLLTGRVGQAEEVAEGYLFLMKGSYTTGTCIVIDGGAMLT
ncbi:hypothetical protein QFC19_002849 [Naganishia cerealis]|uniref:Uncharacterized protein n=1 Tax=Naganishia cerealis TaxID=610337 RepID=A0ACC2W7K5_9TREE|nr:hypothetical protein QFC19_002849 [Naganishia cerealis]